jgi:hypothetical protein
MRAFLACTAALLLLVVYPRAQERPRADEKRDEQLGAYLRVGRYADARRVIDQMLRAQRQEDLENLRAVFAGPNMSIRRGSASFSCDVDASGVRVPLTINGTAANWLLDTGANISVISDAEAARLGLGVRESAGRLADLAGGTIPARTAVAHRVVIGHTLLREVSVLVSPADQEPWKETAPGRQGILGLPLAIALGAVQWNRDGLCRTGSAVLDQRAAPDVSNRLRYDRLQVISTVVFDRKPLEFVLDTGNQAGTQLWERFGRDFQRVVAEQGTKGTATVTQLGAATDREVVTIPDLRLRVGGKDLALTRGSVFSKPVGDDRFHGLLGMDALSQATEVRIDFRSMTLTLQ